MDATRLAELRGVAREVRRDILEIIHRAGSGHPGGSLSAVEILVALYWEVLRHDPANPGWPGRDRLILSKGHGAPALYSVLARRGYFPREELNTLRQFGSILQGHPDSKRTPGVEVSTGSLGQGLSVGVGLALGAKVTGHNYRVFVVLGDGECDEGQVWEAAMSAAHYRLDNLTAVIDFNGVQLDGPTRDIMQLDPFREKWAAFGWQVEVADGHDLEDLTTTLARRPSDRPKAVVARTVKGCGVSFMEGKYQWHGGAPNAEELAQALSEIARRP